MDFATFIEIARALDRNRVEYVLVGEVALNLHGILRATEDVDFFVRPDRENIERLRAALRSLWDDPELDEISADDFAGEYATLRYGPPEGDFVVDIITQIGTAFRFEDLAAERRTIEGVPVRLATPETLVRMKKGTLRPIDQADAAALAEKFGIPEED